jgi:hypothetical protein
MNVIANLLAGLGQSLSQSETAVSDAATQAFYVIAGELALIIVGLTVIIVRGELRK